MERAGEESLMGERRSHVCRAWGIGVARGLSDV